MRVHINSHVEFEGHHYSVPHALVGLALELRVSTHAVEALHKGHRVAGHRRSAHKGGYTTVLNTCPNATSITPNGRPSGWRPGVRASAWRVRPP